MLKAVATLNRKITRDFNSAGYGITIEGEIAAVPDDHDGVLGKIRELFALAQEALSVEIDRDQGDAAIGRRDAESPPPPVRTNGNGNQPDNPPRRNGNGATTDDAVTDKQVKFVFNLAKRNRLSNNDLEAQIEQVLGRRAQVYDLTKREAGRVIDALTQGNGDRVSNQR